MERENKNSTFLSTQNSDEENNTVPLQEVNSRMETDSDNCPSYTLSIGQMMVENRDQGIDCEIDSASSLSDQQQELEFLLRESKIPMNELIQKYEYNENGAMNHEFGETFMDFDKKRRYSDRLNYDENADMNEFIVNREMKYIQIGPMYQVDVPLLPSKELITQTYDEMLWEGNNEKAVYLTRFYQSIRKARPKICYEDELIMCLYRKHNGNIETALRDKEELDKIEVIHHSPLTEFSGEETLNFKNAMIRCGKNFQIIQRYFYPNRSIKSIVNFYYIWKKSPLYWDYLQEIEAIKGKSREATEEDTENVNDEEFCNGHAQQPQNNGMDNGINLYLPPYCSNHP